MTVFCMGLRGVLITHEAYERIKGNVRSKMEKDNSYIQVGSEEILYNKALTKWKKASEKHYAALTEQDKAYLKWYDEEFERISAEQYELAKAEMGNDNFFVKGVGKLLLQLLAIPDTKIAITSFSTSISVVARVMQDMKIDDKFSERIKIVSGGTLVTGVRPGFMKNMLYARAAEEFQEPENKLVVVDFNKNVRQAAREGHYGLCTVKTDGVTSGVWQGELLAFAAQNIFGFKSFKKIDVGSLIIPKDGLIRPIQVVHFEGFTKQPRVYDSFYGLGDDGYMKLADLKRELVGGLNNPSYMEGRDVSSFLSFDDPTYEQLTTEPSTTTSHKNTFSGVNNPKTGDERDVSGC